ncbi:hypothetical protein C9374_004158 [Naegleria lovaniensis]|uniref:Uncharacterized protein n=1 Tax=Naegleria lovaniensis TaxID=51637 RepID=A0AA88GRZ3_NAELO|nr:uncharacterized protein C9374_004158 [Naegleria lovaniensis]KAG2383487.1 hypothetical protein C9374_004158 [Naegleria lovaniensis]
MLPSILDELNSLVDAYYEQVTAIHARTMRLYYASGLLAIITFGTSMLAFMCWYFCCFRKRNNKMMQQLEIRVKSELQQVIERENVKLQNHGLELVGHHKKEPIRKGRRMVLEDSFQVELFAFRCQNNHVSRGNSNHPASAMPYYQQ